MRRHIVMKDLAPAQLHDDEYIKDTESGCEHHEKVTSDDGLGMIVHEGQPSLTRIWRPTAMAGQIFLHRARGNSDSQLQFQLVGDVLLAPSGILSRHLPNQLLEVLGHGGSSHRFGLPAPEQAEPSAMPSDQRIRLHHHERVAPVKQSA